MRGFFYIFAAAFIWPNLLFGGLRYPQGPFSLSALEGNFYAFLGSIDNNAVAIITGSSTPYSFRTVELTGRPSQMVISPNTYNLFVLDSDTSEVVRINPVTGATLKTTGFGKNPSHIAITQNNGALVVSNSGANTVSTFTEGLQTATSRTVGNRPGKIAVYKDADAGDPDLVFVINELDGSVTRLDDITWTASTLTIPDVGRLTDITVSQSTGRVYVTDTDLSKLYILDGLSTPMTLEETYNVCAYPIRAVVNDSRSQVHILCKNVDELMTFWWDVAPDYSHTQISQVVGTGQEPIDIAVFDDDDLADTDQIYVLSSLSKSLTIINDPKPDAPATPNFTIQTVSLSYKPTAMAIRTGATPADVRIFISHYDDGVVTIVTPDAAPSKTEIRLPNEAEAIGQYDSGALNKLFVTHPSSNELSIIDVATSEMTFAPFCAGGQTCTSPTSLMVLPTIDRVYVANKQSANVEIINAATNAHVATLGVGSEPIALTSDITNSRAYSLNRIAETVTVFNTATSTIVRTDSVGSDPSAIAVNPGLRMIYVTNSADDSVTIINDATAAVTEVAVGKRPIDVVVDATGNRAFILNYGSNSISVIGALGTVTATIGLCVTPRHILYDVSRNLLAISAPSQKEILILDAGDANYPAVKIFSFLKPPSRIYEDTRDDVFFVLFPSENKIRTILPGNYGMTEMPAGTNPYSIVVDTATAPSTFYSIGQGDYTIYSHTGVFPDLPERDPVHIPHSFASLSATDQVFLINRASATLMTIDASAAPPVPPSITTAASLCSTPVAIAAHQARSRLFVACKDSDQVAAFQSNSTFIRNIPVGSKPISLLLNEAANKLYIANSSDGTVSIINTSNDTFAANASSPVTVGARPVSLTLDSLLNKVVVANMASNSYSTIASNESVTTTTLSGYSTPFKVFYNDALNPAELFLAAINKGGVFVGPLSFLVSGTLTNLKYPTNMAVNKTGAKVYVTYYYEDKMRIYDEAADTLKEVSTGEGPYEIAVAPNQGKVYVLNRDEDTISVFNAATDVVLSTLALPHGSNPCSLYAFDDSADPNDWLFVGLCGTNQIEAIRMDTDVGLALLELN